MELCASKEPACATGPDRVIRDCEVTADVAESTSPGFALRPDVKDGSGTAMRFTRDPWPGLGLMLSLSPMLLFNMTVTRNADFALVNVESTINYDIPTI